MNNNVHVFTRNNRLNHGIRGNEYFLFLYMFRFSLGLVSPAHDPTSHNKWIGLSWVPYAILPNSLLGFGFSIEYYVFAGSLVPIASGLMVRSLFYNGVLNQRLISSSINLIINQSLRISLIMNPSVLMLYSTTFYEMTHRPYILESYIIDISVLSFSHPSTYPHTFFLFCFPT